MALHDHDQEVSPEVLLKTAIRQMREAMAQGEIETELGKKQMAVLESAIAQLQETEVRRKNEQSNIRREIKAAVKAAFEFGVVLAKTPDRMV